MFTIQRREQRPKTAFFILSGILCLALIGARTSPSFAQEDLTLSLSSGQGAPTQTVNLTLSLSYPSAATASGFQLDINYATDVLENPSATKGQVLIDAGKDIETNDNSGEFSIVVSGLNQDIIQAGNAATISFDIKSGASPGVTDLTLSGLHATEPNGDPLVVAGSNGSVEVLDVVIPTLSEWGIIIFTTLIMGIGVVILRKRRTA